VTCPTCGQAAKFQDYREKTPISLLGEIHCERAYYYCGHCGHGLFPWDQTVGLTPKRLTPAAERVVSLAGLLSDSFAEAAQKVLPELAGLHLCESTAERTTEDAGERLGKLLAEGHTIGPRARWGWHVDAQGRTCAYVSVDATGVPQQGPGGSLAEGRMPYVGMVYNPVPEFDVEPPDRQPRREAMQARYLSGLYTLDELGLQLRRQAGQVGMDAADCWIGLTDGGNGLEHFLQTNFPRDLTVILDFWHAAEYLADMAKTLHPSDEEQAQALTTEWCHTMKQEGGAAIVNLLEKIELPPRKPTIVAKREEVLNYLKKNVHRMDYPTYVANGWLIGSGAVESACKTVVGQRLKLAGMRWGEDGTDAVCHLRALFKSERTQWRDFWERSIN
jgi:hypothetical protein